MIPRYLPTVQLSSWVRWLFSGRAEITRARESLLATLSCPPGFSASAFPRARHALQAYFQDGLGGGGRVIVVSAQICSLVPLLARQCGFDVRFVDIDEALPVPSAQQYREAICENTAGVIVAPMYGLMARDCAPLLEAIRDQRSVKLILDLAQGLGLHDEIQDLRASADALVYSFGVGKGLDCGGGLLMTRSPLPRRHPHQRASLAPLVQSIGVRVCSALGLYRWLAGSLDSAVENDKKPETLAGGRASSAMYCLWHDRLQKFRAEVETARQRSCFLATLPNLIAMCRDREQYLSGHGAQLRQVIRFKDPAVRDPFLRHVRAHGLDAAPAGESLPSEYYPELEASVFPNAAAFRHDSVRLPFLGRLTERQFMYLVQQLEAYGAIRLSA